MCWTFSCETFKTNSNAVCRYKRDIHQARMDASMVNHLGLILISVVDWHSQNGAFLAHTCYWGLCRAAWMW